jgi:hypothetical protein
VIAIWSLVSYINIDLMADRELVLCRCAHTCIPKYGALGDLVSKRTFHRHKKERQEQNTVEDDGPAIPTIKKRRAEEEATHDTNVDGQINDDNLDVHSNLHDGQNSMEDNRSVSPLVDLNVVKGGSESEELEDVDMGDVHRFVNSDDDELEVTATPPMHREIRSGEFEAIEEVDMNRPEFSDYEDNIDAEALPDIVNGDARPAGFVEDNNSDGDDEYLEPHNYDDDVLPYSDDDEEAGLREEDRANAELQEYDETDPDREYQEQLRREDEDNDQDGNDEPAEGGAHDADNYSEN